MHTARRVLEMRRAMRLKFRRMRRPPVMSRPTLIYPDSISGVHVWDPPLFQLVIQSLSVERQVDNNISSVWWEKPGGRGEAAWVGMSLRT
jgi:hypothetical protein